MSKRYPLRRGESLAALEGIDLDVAPGEFVALIGPSGCGKSTLLRLVGALERPSTGSVLVDGQSPDALARICREVIEDDAAEGVVYSQPMIAPTYYVERMGLSLEEVWPVMRDAFEGAAREAGIEVGYLVGIDRARPVEEAEAAATFAAAHAGEGIVGFGFGGDERIPPEKLSRACAIAREAALMIVPHAGESLGPESVRAALALGPRRIAHGVRTVEDGDLLARLAGEGIACDVCPTSNLRLGVVSDLAAHQLPVLLEAGVPVRRSTRTTSSSSAAGWARSTL